MISATPPVVRNERSSGHSVLSVRIDEKRFSLSPILGSIAFDVEPNQFVVVLGPSGCGKTTLLRILSGLDRDFAGTVLLGSKPVTRPSSNIALMFQDVRLLPWMTVELNIKFATAAVQNPKSPQNSLSAVGLDPAVLSFFPRKLSGGMAKRVALARALAANPAVLLLDEPFSELDTAAKYNLYDLLVETVHSRDAPVAAVMVTHDISEAVYLADKILVLSGGRPASISSVVPVTLPRPRYREDAEFIKLCTSLMVAAISDVESTLMSSNADLRK
jgi:ABC-type nitrate/sulfonate/bicarbonate transport system ATPase subunit